MKNYTTYTATDLKGDLVKMSVIGMAGLIIWVIDLEPVAVTEAFVLGGIYVASIDMFWAGLGNMACRIWPSLIDRHSET